MKTSLLFLALFSVSNLFGQTPGAGVTDIDGNFYETVIIGTQEWMTENLKTSRYSNGDTIPSLSTADWQFTTNGSWRFYNDDDSLGAIYGKLYNFYTVVDQRGVCPSGWNAGSLYDWQVMIDFLGGYAIAGGKMKTIGTIEDNNGLWLAPNTSASNSSNFSAIPSGYLTWGGNQYNKLNEYAYYWTTTEGGNITSGESESIRLYNTAEYLSFVENKRTSGFAVRCMRMAGTGNLFNITIDKQLVQILDLMGRETTYKPNTLLIYVYDDGSTEKVFKTE